MAKPRVRIEAMNFGASLHAFAENTASKLDEAHRAIVIEVFSGIIYSTPIGDPKLWKWPAPKGYIGGLARGNWQTTIGVIAKGNLGLRSGEAAIWEVGDNAGKAGDTVFMSNGLPYINRLEYEQWSTQAPAGMVRINMTRVQQTVADVVAKVNT